MIKKWGIALWMSSSLVFAQGLDDFLKLNEQLPTAVCDEAAVARAPSLGLQKNPQSSWVWIRLKKTPKEILEILFENRFSLASTLTLPEEVKTPEQLLEWKRKISLRICSSSFTQASSEKLFAQMPLGFMEVDDHEPKILPPDQSLFMIWDSERRIGKISGKTRLPGWIEPFEIHSVRVLDRVYRRLSQPFTDRLQAIVLEDSAVPGVPLGVFHLARPEAGGLLSVSDRIQEFQELILLEWESACAQKLKEKSKNAAWIQKIQESGRKEILVEFEKEKKSFQIPNSLRESELKQFQAVRINGAKLEWVPFFKSKSLLDKVQKNYQKLGAIQS